MPTPSPTTPDDGTKVPLVSMIALLCNPTQFDGKQIQVMGFAHIEFEDMAIYLGSQDSRYGLISNGIWLDIQGSDLARYKELNNTYIIVQGTFYGDSRKEFFGYYYSGIKKITMMRRWARTGARPSKPS